MPTFADLQALRQQTPELDKSFSQSEPTPTETKKPTLADLQSLRDQTPDLDIPAESAAPRKPGMGEKALGVLAAPGFAASEIIADPNKSNKIVSKGFRDIPQSTWDKEKADVQGIKSGVEGAIDPNRSGLSRTLQGGKAALNAISMPFEPAVAGIENTYGRLAREGSKMTQPDGQALIGPGSASILPTLFLGGGKKKTTEFADAAKDFGMDFSKSKDPEDIAKEIGRSTDNYFDKLTSMIWDRSPAPAKTGGLGELAKNALGNFTQRKKDEAAAWADAENNGNRIIKDHGDEIDRLTEMRKGVTERIKNGEDTTDVKKAQAMIDRALGELGAPIQPEQQIIEKTRDIGGRTQTSTADRQYVPKNESTKLEVEPTTSLGANRFSETSQTPMARTVQQSGKSRTVETSPYTVTTKTIKGKAPEAPRAGTAADLVRARRAVNDSAYSTADGSVSREVKGVLQDGLSDVSKQNKEFGLSHSKALQKTQANADIYRDDAKAARFGFDEDTLKELGSKIKNGRELSTDVLEKINSGVTKIKTPEDLLFLQRHLDKPEFSMALRAKAAAVLSDVGTDYKKVKEQRPMLEKIYEFAGMPKAKIQKSLDNLETVSKEMQRYGIPTKPSVDPALSKMQSRAKSIVKALTLGLAYSNPKQAMYHLGQAAMPSPNADALALQAFAKGTKPTQQMNGAAVAGAMNAIQRPGGADQSMQNAVAGPQ